jgi:hypothetical protein
MANNPPTFELARFVWEAPDRLEVSGRFIGLPYVPADDPVLVVDGVDGTHRLPVVSDSFSGPPKDDRRWNAAFAWQEAPVAFKDAKLEFGGDIVVELPEPAASRMRSRRRTLAVTMEGGQKQADGRRPPRRAEDVPAVEPQGVQRLRVQADLLAANEALRATQSELQRIQEELNRARTDLASERQLRRADAERFRQGLAEIRDAAAQALNDHQSAEQRLGAELRDARATIEAKDAALEKLGGQLEAAAAKHAEAESEAAAEIKGLRERLAGLEAAGGEADQLRAELETSRRQADETRAQLDSARSAMEAARSDAEQLLGRLSRLRDAGGDSG